MKLQKFTFFITILLIIPQIAFGQSGIKGLIGGVGSIVSSLILLMAGIALLVFFWGIMKVFFQTGDEKARTEGKNIMVWGLITLFIMMSVWGIIQFFQSEFNITPPSYGTPTSPTYTPPCDNDIFTDAPDCR